MSRHHTSIANAALDLANLAREAHALETAVKMFPQSNSKLDDMIADREEDLAAEFATLAKLLGYSVSKIEPAALEAAE